MSESVRGGLAPTVERREWFRRNVAELLIELTVIWVLVFGLLIVLLSVTVSPSYGALSIVGDAWRGATLVDSTILILIKLLPAK